MSKPALCASFLCGSDSLVEVALSSENAAGTVAARRPGDKGTCSVVRFIGSRDASEMYQKAARNDATTCSRYARRFQVVDDTLTFKIGRGDAGTLFASTFNLPPISKPNQFHLAS